MTEAKTCAAEGCDRPAKSLGWCGMHRERVRNNGDPNIVQVIQGDPNRRFWLKVDRRGDEECWPWLGTILAVGYGQFQANGRRYLAHRYAYELVVGEIPPGLTLDHVAARGCTRTDCVNTAHLEPVTAAENNRRSGNRAGLNSRKTACPRCGGPYDTDSKGKRYCRPCRRAWRPKRGQGAN